MICACPLASVYSEKGESSGKNVTLPTVVKAPIQPDTMNFVHTNLRQNDRQPYPASELVGHQTRAESWGYRQSCGLGAQSLRQWDSSLQPQCFWKYVSQDLHVCTIQSLVPWAP